MDHLGGRYLSSCSISISPSGKLQMAGVAALRLAGRAQGLAGSVLSGSDWGGGLCWRDRGLDVAGDVPLAAA